MIFSGVQSQTIHLVSYAPPGSHAPYVAACGLPIYSPLSAYSRRNDVRCEKCERMANAARADEWTLE
jgi:hypothetical protein